MIYSTTPYLITVDTTIYAIVCFLSCIVCILSLLCSIVICGNSRNSFFNLCYASIVVFFFSAGISVYKDITTEKRMYPNQRKVTATLVSVTSKEVIQTKGRVDNVTSVLYRIENGDLIALPVQYGVPIHQNVFLYVKTN